MKVDVRIYRKNEKGAQASITLDEAFAVRGIRVVEGSKGPFVSFPARSYEQDGEKKYSEYCFPVTAEARKDIVDAVLSAYEAAEAE